MSEPGAEIAEKKKDVHELHECADCGEKSFVDPETGAKVIAQLPACCQEPPISERFQGHLEKKNSRGVFKGSYKKRLFVIDFEEGCMKYFTKNGPPKRSYDIIGIGIEDMQGTAFRITTPDKKSVKLRASSENECQTWKEQIRKCQKEYAIRVEFLKNQSSHTHKHKKNRDDPKSPTSPSAQAVEEGSPKDPADKKIFTQDAAEFEAKPLGDLEIIPEEEDDSSAKSVSPKPASDAAEKEVETGSTSESKDEAKKDEIPTDEKSDKAESEKETDKKESAPKEVEAEKESPAETALLEKVLSQEKKEEESSEEEELPPPPPTDC